MNLTCQHCNTKLSIPDHKLLKDKEATLKCPKCQGKIKIGPPSAKPVSDFVGQHALSSFEDRLNGLICVGNNDLKNKIFSVTRKMGMSISDGADTKTALSKLEYYVYHLIVMDDAFDLGAGPKNVMDRLNNIDMSLRRRICLVKISDDINTNDNMTALHTSVNAICHCDDVIHFEAFLTKTLSEHKSLYTVFNESLKQAGKA